MKFLLNMNLPRSLLDHLEKAGYTARHVGDIGLNKALDMQIIEEARKSEEIILTHDLDYGQLLSFEGTVKPSVIIFRLRNTSPRRAFDLLNTLIPKIERSILSGAVVIIEEDIIRIRSLPIIRKRN